MKKGTIRFPFALVPEAALARNVGCDAGASYPTYSDYSDYSDYSGLLRINLSACALPAWRWCRRRGTPYEIFNVSLTQTLHRTLITSGTTLMVILMLYLFGGPVLEGFSLTMLIGVSIGTASSIYVASALALKLGMKREHMLQQKVEKEGADQPSILP